MNTTIFRFALIKGLRNPLTLIFNCILPPALMLIRPLWTGENFLSGYGLLILVIWGGAFLMAQGTISDRESGAITRIMSAPISMRNYLMQNLFAYMVPLTIQVALITALGVILYDWGLTLALGLFLCYTVFTATSVMMSFAWNCLFKKKESSFTTFGAVVTFGSMLSGAYVPLELLPEALQYVGAIFPAYWGMRGISSLLELGAISIDYWIGIAAMIMFMIVFLLYGGKRRMI
ncbi:MAG: ABC transporter permease [Defluviitaleaceae bacterium]|nr:ABC transporter permease [Defluviitaleaceae bacterium]